jgi:hypothetical protein
MSMPLTYTALDSSKRQIRIIRLTHEPAVNSTTTSAANVVVPDLTLDFRLEVASLDDRPAYTALSYVWGTDPPRNEITIDGASFLVTQSLHTALTHLQFEDVASGLWIDSICINQSDNDEKAKQVAEMGSIFSQAENVLIWFGTATERGNVIADVIYQFPHELQKTSDETCRELDDYFELLFELESTAQLDSLIGKAMSTPENRALVPAQDFYLEFYLFLDGIQWWRRIWVIQEFVLASNCHFQFGTRKIEFDAFCLMMICSMNVLSGSVSALWFNNRTDEHLRGYKTAKPNLDLYTTLVAHRTGKSLKYDLFYMLCRTYCRPLYFYPPEYRSSASILHDYIYGLAGLAGTEYADLGLSFDYNKKWQDVYLELALAMIKSGKLDILALCQSNYYFPPEKQEVPSWVPQWHKKICPTTRWFINPQAGKTALGNSLFSASASTKVQCSLQEADTGPYLKITGVPVGTVKWVGFWHARSCAGLSGKSFTIERQMLYAYLEGDIQKACELSRKIAPDLYPRSVLDDAFWRLPLMDHQPVDTVDELATCRASSTVKVRMERIRWIRWGISEYMGIKHTALRLPKLSYYHKLRGWLCIQRHKLKLSYFISMYKHYNCNFAKRWLLWVLGCPGFLWTPSDPLTELGLPSAQDNKFNETLTHMEVGLPIRPFMLKNGYIGVGPGPMIEGDLIVIFHGSNVPHVLRNTGASNDDYRLIGEAYVLGIMDGEYISDDQEPVDFKLF